MTRNSGKKAYLRIGRSSVITGTCILYFLSLSPVSNGLIYSLENQYPYPAQGKIEMVDIIVVLGGGIYPVGGPRKDPEASGTTYSRLFNGVKIFKKSNAKFLVLSGKGEAEVMGDLAVKIGVPQDKIIIESRSKNTMEHAIELRRLFPQTKRVRIGIVTSALHMPRAILSFKKIFADDTILPIPVGYTYSLSEYNIRSIIPSAEDLSTSSYAIHEWIGMIWYKVIRKSMQVT